MRRLAGAKKHTRPSGAEPEKKHASWALVTFDTERQASSALQIGAAGGLRVALDGGDEAVLKARGPAARAGGGEHTHTHTHTRPRAHALCARPRAHAHVRTPTSARPRAQLT